MTNIPFPNPHDADVLNDYLDSLVAGKPANPGTEVESAAQEFHALASRANVHAPQQSGTFAKGQETMHTATLAAPVSNRTRKQFKSESKGKSYGWLSAVIVAGLLLSMLGSAWINREPRNPNENLAWAPGTAEAIENDALDPESNAWIADFDAADCTETSDLQDVTIDYQAMQNLEPQGYGIVGPAQSDEASAAVEQYRAMRGCETFGDAWAYWTEARINEHTRVLNDQNRAELAELESHFAEKYPQQFMVVMNDPTVSPEIEAEWAARESEGTLGQPIPLEAKLNPEFAVELNDGRIALPATVVYSLDDPAIKARGFPEENPASTVVLIFAMEDGSWKYDDSLALCLVNCANGMGTPLDAAENPWAKDLLNQTCSAQPASPDSPSSGNYELATTDFESREYNPIGPADSEAANEAGEVVTAWNICSSKEGDTSYQTLSYMSQLGAMNMHYLVNDGTGDPFVSAPYLRQWENGSTDLVTGTMLWNQISVLDEPVRTTFGSLTWEPVAFGDAPNTASVRTIMSQQGFNPATAVELSDGRITVFSAPTISIEDRGAVTYEGNRPLQQVAGVTLKQFDGQWLVDELITAQNGVFAHNESTSWWWGEEFDTPDVPWTQPISYAECPQDAVIPVDRENNPSGTRYSPEDYEGLTSERDYEIVGPADPEDAQAVVTSMRETLACGTRNQGFQRWTARFEWENRTTAGRESLADIEDDRAEASVSVSNWLQDDLGLTPMDMVVNQDPSELELDGSEALITQGLPNPAYAVEFADGRIGIIPSGVYYSGLPEGMNEDTLPGFAQMMSIFVYQDGEWLLDENLQVCIGDCSATPAASPVVPDGDVWGVTTDPMATPEE